ncbi:hypothetical protein M406DRAFT_74917 [Cryphonectria parasitica EP155]|uniref:Heterokaryon incompatibility domain-containing protein n=1 Tax=Cryphonectria parasitica (strain ATCC 38755 / EP155) TaxID=660469 RepID=A0A9P4XWS2_CRYP1|nr:uncharacterized protein M406DRAFT_74917 [Cryphonectria parasitica EP155]KAF3762000.1 hypothetical protein M406DRAFT_74917 [Cryphonectria parasitica EP155]
MAEASSKGRCSSLYEQLPLPPGSIRLLRLANKTNNGNGDNSNKLSEAVTGQLATFSLNQPDCPSFTTVSYTWGTEYADEHIHISGHQIRVLQNLLPFLRMISSRRHLGGQDLRDEEDDDDKEGEKTDDDDHDDDADKWLWIDSICINQTDLAERASQVHLMGQIYHQAARTLVWLGERTEETDQAIAFLSLLGRRRKEFRAAVHKRRIRIPPDLQGHPGWRSLDGFLQNTWWRRVWTLQEFIVPRDLCFHCGPTSLTREAFRQGIDALELFSSFKAYVRPSVWTTAWNRRRIMDWYQVEPTRHNMSLISLMAFCGDYGVTDARDRIWAVHGLAREQDRQMIGRPTYDDDASTLWIRLVRQFVDTFNCLDIICFAQLFHNQHPDWPSWAPDWRVPVLQPSVVPLMVSQSTNEHLANFRPVRKPRDHKRDAAYKASKEEPPRIKSWGSPPGGGHLVCEGILLDHIDGLGPIPHEPATVVESTSRMNIKTTHYAQQEKDRWVILQSVTRALVLDRLDRFLERAAPVSQYARDLRHLVAAYGDQDNASGAAPKWFGRWWRRHADPALRIKGWTLGELCVSDQRDETRQSAPMGPKSFLSRLRGTMEAQNRRLMVTNLGFPGMAPRRAQKGDAVCVLFGCNVPVVLRRREQQDPQGISVFELVGECFVDGFMKGEALRTGKPTEDFAIA